MVINPKTKNLDERWKTILLDRPYELVRLTIHHLTLAMLKTSNTAKSI